MEWKKEYFNYIIIAIVTLVLLLSAFIIYDKVLTRKPDSKYEYDEKYNSNDYVNIIKIKCDDCKKKGDLNKAEFKNLSDELTKDFDIKQKEFEELIKNDEIKETEYYSKVIKTVKNNILSLYRETLESKETEIYNIYSLNIDLENKKIISKEEFIKQNELNLDEIYRKILLSILENKEIVVRVSGDIDKKLENEEFLNNKNNYIEILKNKNLLVFYFDEGKMFAGYIQSKILEEIDLHFQLLDEDFIDVQRIELK